MMTDDSGAPTTETKQSPIVKEIKWGCVHVENFGEFKDVKLYPGGE